MTSDDLIAHARRMADELAKSEFRDPSCFYWKTTPALEFLRKYSGTNSSFAHTACSASSSGSFAYQAKIISGSLRAYADYVAAGLATEISPERKAQLDVVSDLLEQANTLLQSKNVHPAAPAVLIGATLEEFLRTWIESANLPLGGRKPSLDSYTQVLREANLIDKQDAKDITSWAGIRNYAAHGEWEHVKSHEQILVMLQGVNLFMRKHEGPA